MEKHRPKMIYRKILFAATALCAMTAVAISPAAGQGTDTGAVSGRVTSQTGDAMAGVTVVIPGTNVGRVTSADGSYTIPAPSMTDTLTFSFIGYTTVTEPILNRTIINVVMQEETTAIEEVVVVGYGMQKKESLVAAISQVSGDELTRTTATSISTALSGQIPGLTSMQGSGQPGSDRAALLVRGVSSWQGSEPLVMVDGVERDFNDIDPREIENISVLKDASATAVYGTRGANGVILINTKRGKKGDVKVNFSANYDFTQPTILEKPVDSYQTALFLNEAYRNDGNFGAVYSDEILEHYRVQDMPYVYPNTNWIDLMIKDVAFGQRYNLNVSGGSDFARVFASLSYSNEGDIMKLHKMPGYDPRYQYERVNYRFNIDLDLTPTTSLSLDAGGFISTQTQPGESGGIRRFRTLLFQGPMEIPAIYPGWLLEQYPDPAHPDETGDRIAMNDFPEAESPLMTNQYGGSTENRRNNLNTTIKLKQKLDFITEGLSIQFMGSYNNMSQYSKSFQESTPVYKLTVQGEEGTWRRKLGRNGTEDDPWVPTVPTLESLAANSPNRSWYLEGSINYARSFGKHNVTGMVLFQRRKVQRNVEFPHYEQGMVARITYDYHQRYMLEGNLGYTGSEQFAPENRYGLFPSIAAGWNVHNEKFFAPLTKIVNRLKIRASYGQVGSDNSPGRWLYTSSYAESPGASPNANTYKPGSQNSAGTSYTLITEQQMANIHARWEVATKQDIGFEIGFLKNMFSLNLDFYREHRTGILLNRNSVSSLLGIGMKAMNLGETKTQGYEIDLKFQYTTGRGLFIYVKPAIAFSDNRIISKDEPMGVPGYMKVEGKRIDQVFGFHMLGYIQDADERMNSIHLGQSVMGLGDIQWLDFNGDGLIDQYDKVPMGYANTYPLYNYSLAAGLSYKGFSFDILFQAVSHFTRPYMRDYNWPLSIPGTNHVFDYQMDTWSPDNRYASYPAAHTVNSRVHNDGPSGANSQMNVHDASYLRLKNVRIAYTLPQKWTKKAAIRSCDIYVSGNNLFTYAPGYSHADPESNKTGNDFSEGNYPMTRNFSVGLDFSF